VTPTNHREFQGNTSNKQHFIHTHIGVQGRRQTNLSECPLRRRPRQPTNKHLGAFHPAVCTHTSTGFNAQQPVNSHTTQNQIPEIPERTRPASLKSNNTKNLTLLVVVPLRRRPPILKSPGGKSNVKIRDISWKSVRNRTPRRPGEPPAQPGAESGGFYAYGIEKHGRILRVRGVSTIRFFGGDETRDRVQGAFFLSVLQFSPNYRCSFIVRLLR
jgi:hypothetical protein